MVYIRALFPDEIKKVVVRALQLAVLPVAAMVLFLPLSTVRLTISYYDLVRIAGAVYLLIGMVAAARSGRKGARLTIASFSVLVCA